MAVINREALIEEYKENQSRKVGDDIGFTWVVKAHKISLVSALEMAEQVNQWKDLKNGGVREVRANDYNNKEFVVEGKKWYVLIAQHYTNGEMEDDTNIMCPVSLMLFGTMVSGMTYAFEKKEDRDNFFDAINSSKRIKITQTKVPICGLCGKGCDCPHGHNPYPLLENSRRVCDKCNAEQVIPARRKGVRRSEDLKTNQDDYDTFLGECLKPMNDGIFQLEQELLDGEKMLPLDTDFPADIKIQYNKCYDERERLFIKANKEVSKYIKERFDRQLKVRCIVSPESVLLTAGSAIHQSIARELNENVLRRLAIIAVYKDRLETELINTDIAPQQEKVKTKAELKKEQTRNANKAKAEEKKLKEEQDKAQAQAQAYAEAQRKQKAKAIAIKKQKAIIAEAERYLEKLKAEGV